jgi:hypothetical protein
MTVGARGGSGFGRMGVDGVSGVVVCTGAVGTATVRTREAAPGVGGWAEMRKRLAARVLEVGVDTLGGGISVAGSVRAKMAANC